MANELQAYTTTGKTLYAVILDDTGQIWNGSSFVAINAGNWTDYDIALTESTAGIYLANLPALSAGIFTYVVYEQAGASPATTDTKLGIGYVNWDGSAILPLSTIDTVVDAILVDTGTTLDDKLDILAYGYPNVIVEDCGDLGAIGTYIYVSQENSRPKYESASGYYIEYDSAWKLYDGSSNLLYIGTDDVETPDMVVTWSVWGGASLPLPTISGCAKSLLDDVTDKIDTVDGIVDDILVDTGTTLPATLTTMEGKIDTVDGLIDSIMGATWSDEDLVAIKAAIDAVSVGSGASAEDVWTYASRELSTPADYKADVSDLALEATVDALENVSAADIWGYSTRTLTNQGTSVESPATGDPLEIYRDTTVVISLTSLGDVSDYTNIWFTAKEDPENEADSVAVIQIDMTTGLLYIDGVAPTAAAEGSIVFSSETAGDCTITIAEEAAADLPIFEAYPINWDIKMLKSGVVSILSYGEMYIYATPTRTIV